MFLEKYRRHRQPVIVVDEADNLVGSSGWSIDFLRQRVGHHAVPIEYSLRPIFHPKPDISRSIYHRKMVKFADGLTLIDSQPKQRYWYYFSTIPVSDLQEIAEEVRRPVFLPPDRYRTAALFVGNDQTGTQFHYDLTTNFLRVFSGCKRVRMIAPCINRMYPLSVKNPLCNFSQLDFEKPDTNRFPRATNLEVWEGAVRPGEMLYIPSLWWHHVVNVGLTIGVTFIWNESVDQARHRQWWRVQLSHRLMSHLEV